MREPVQLSVTECEELLGSGMVGRLAITTPGGPRIVPVNYALHDNTLLFRTSPYSELATYARGALVAFEIDHFDYEQQTGWSVLAMGRLEEADPDEVSALCKVWEPRAWAGGQRTFFMTLAWRELTGRRIGTWAPRAMTPVRRVL